MTVGETCQRYNPTTVRCYYNSPFEDEDQMLLDIGDWVEDLQYLVAEDFYERDTVNYLSYEEATRTLEVHITIDWRV